MSMNLLIHPPCSVSPNWDFNFIPACSKSKFPILCSPCQSFPYVITWKCGFCVCWLPKAVQVSGHLFTCADGGGMQLQALLRSTLCLFICLALETEDARNIRNLTILYFYSCLTWNLFLKFGSLYQIIWENIFLTKPQSFKLILIRVVNKL